MLLLMKLSFLFLPCRLEQTAVRGFDEAFPCEVLFYLSFRKDLQSHCALTILNAELLKFSFRLRGSAGRLPQLTDLLVGAAIKAFLDLIVSPVVGYRGRPAIPD